MIYNLILKRFTEYLSKQTSFITGKWTLPHHSLTTGSNKVAAILVWTCFHFFFAGGSARFSVSILIQVWYLVLYIV